MFTCSIQQEMTFIVGLGSKDCILLVTEHAIHVRLHVQYEEKNSTKKKTFLKNNKKVFPNKISA